MSLGLRKRSSIYSGKHWRPAIATGELKQETDTIGEVAQGGSDTNHTGEIDQGSGMKPETEETDSMGENDQGCDFDEENDETDPTGDIDHELDEGDFEMPSDAACEYLS